MLDYKDFLQQKQIEDPGNGFDLPKSELNPMLFEFQKDITLWGLRKGRTLIGLNCGLGKGPIQLEWLKQVCKHTDKPVIMFAPPGVKTQFKYEAEKFGYDVKIVAENEDIVNGINITNYERLIIRERVPLADWNTHCQKYKAFKPVELKRDDTEVYTERFRFSPGQFSGIALDEGSILKHYGAKTRDRLTNFAKNIPFRIIGTATPSPNDFIELINYASFLGIMNDRQAKALYFIQDGNSSNKFRIKRPAWTRWWKFVSSWSIMIRSPSDLGYSDDGYILPKLTTRYHTIKDTSTPDGMLIPLQAKTMSEINRVKRLTVEERCKIAAEIAMADDDHKLIYVRRNDEGILLNKLLPDAVEVAGRHSEKEKEDRLIGFAQGKYPILITKPEIGGFGLNLQEYCHRIISTNVNYSNEEMYQYVRRVYRFMQENDVEHDVITVDTESDILIALDRKQKQSDIIFDETIKHMNIHVLYHQNGQVKKQEMDYMTKSHREEYWTLMLGDSAERVQELEDQSIGSIITSIPFASAYAYTNSERDIGNYDMAGPLIEHLSYVFKALLPKMMPGRICHMHISQTVSTKERHGISGLMDFRGPLIEMMVSLGWIFHSEVTIEKDPVFEQERTKAVRLLQKTASKKASQLGHSTPDYLLEFRAPGDDPEQFTNLLSDPEVMGNYDSPDGWMHLEMWQNWASCVWLYYRKGMKWWEGIKRGNVLGSRISKDKKRGYGVRDARGKDDERHLCELQLDIIERCIALHSAPGELIVDPFNGIGSTGYQALKMGRRYTGIELKDTYYYTAIKNLRWIEREISQRKFDLFSLMDIKVEQDELMARHKGWINERRIDLQDRSTGWGDWEKASDPSNWEAVKKHDEEMSRRLDEADNPVW